MSDQHYVEMSDQHYVEMSDQHYVEMSDQHYVEMSDQHYVEMSDQHYSERQRRATTFGHEGLRHLESFLTRWRERTFLPLPRIFPPMAMFISNI